MKRLLSASAAAIIAASAWTNGPFPELRTCPNDSIWLSDPAIINVGDSLYVMTGTGGMLWRSTDLETWTGPYWAIDTKDNPWMGERPEVWAAEIHERDGKFYYFATFTNKAITIDAERNLPRRASQPLVSDNPMGPYRPFGDEAYLPADWLTLDGTYWVDADGKPYMVFCHEWLQTGDGTMEMAELKPDLSGTVGQPVLLFKASDSPWSRENRTDGVVKPNAVTDGPYLFRTGTGRLGMIWTSWIGDVYTQGVAYSESGTLAGPWVQEPEPITPPNFGHGMLFTDAQGRTLMSVHSHQDINGRYHRVPHLFEVDLSGDKLVVGPMIR